MVNINKQAYDALVSLGYSVSEQGTMTSANLPATFITYQILADNDTLHADNEPIAWSYLIQAALYSKNPAIMQAARSTLSTPMLAAGFTRASGRVLPFDKQTGHYGYALDFRYYESKEE